MEALTGEIHTFLDLMAKAVYNRNEADLCTLRTSFNSAAGLFNMMSLYVHEKLEDHLLHLKLGHGLPVIKLYPKDQKLFLALKNALCPKMFQKLQVANEEHDSLPFLSRKLNTIKASYLEMLTQSRLRCRRNAELHTEAFVIANACNK